MQSWSHDWPQFLLEQSMTTRASVTVSTHAPGTHVSVPIATPAALAFWAQLTTHPPQLSTSDAVSTHEPDSPPLPAQYEM
jgi:hypothetical protein